MTDIRTRALPAGGAWTIGYKAWGSLLGRRLSKHGALCYCIDYRNFPQVRAARGALPLACAAPRSFHSFSKYSR